MSARPGSTPIASHTGAARAIGVAAGGYYDVGAVQQFAAATEVPVAYCLPVFSDVADGLSGDRLRAVAEAGYVPEVTWQPQRASVAAIARGRWDAVLATSARYTRGQDLRIRFGHEMNGSWNASSAQPADYVRAFRRAHRIFNEQGSRAVWIWTPNITGGYALPFERFFPGDEYCELVGLDGYADADAGYRSFEALFASDLERLGALSGRPLVIGETSIEQGAPDRAGWITDMFAWLGEHPEVRAVTWWNRDEYCISEDEAAVRAFTRGAAGWRAHT